jgi:hypothetical protein
VDGVILRTGYSKRRDWYLVLQNKAGYFTVSGIENEISLTEKDWPCSALKDLSDNAYDWLNDYYYPTTTARHLCITDR